MEGDEARESKAEGVAASQTQDVTWSKVVDSEVGQHTASIPYTTLYLLSHPTPTFLMQSPCSWERDVAIDFIDSVARENEGLERLVRAV